MISPDVGASRTDPGVDGFRRHASRGYNPPLACGGIAQLGERLHGMQEVIGSIPFTSTITF